MSGSEQFDFTGYASEADQRRGFEDWRRQREHREGLAAEQRARDSHPILTFLAFVAVLPWIFALLSLYDAVLTQLPLLQAAIEAVPAAWLRPGWIGLAIRIGIALVYAAPLFVVAAVLKRVRNAVGPLFPSHLLGALACWVWMLSVTTVRVLVDLSAMVTAWVVLQLLREQALAPIGDIGVEGVVAALVFVLPYVLIRSVPLTRRARRV